MTKKLSEIGHTREPEVLIVALQMLEEKHREELLTLLTPAERRDLVRGSIKRFLVGHMLEWRLKCELSTALDKFCEEQGI